MAVRSTCVLVYLQRTPLWIRAESREQALSVAPLIKCPLTKTENQMRDKGKRRRGVDPRLNLRSTRGGKKGEKDG